MVLALEILAHDWFQGRSTYFDVSVISPTCQTYVKKASREQFSAGLNRVMHKVKKYEQLPISFIPLVVETLGAWHPSAIPSLKTIAARLAESKHTDTRTSLSIIMNNLSFRLQKLNADILVSRYANC